jgi:hypothetical protein
VKYRNDKPERSMTYSIPLRPEFIAQLILPVNLTQPEATHLCGLIQALVFPEPKGDTPKEVTE